MFGNDNEMKTPRRAGGERGEAGEGERERERAAERVSDSCDKLQKQNHLSIKLDFTNVLLPDSPLTEEISQHYRAA